MEKNLMGVKDFHGFVMRAAIFSDGFLRIFFCWVSEDVIK